MKCPNCGKEAIFVNGKYVCLDCGIEITPEQQAAQNMNEPAVHESALPDNSTLQAPPEVPETPTIPETPTVPVTEIQNSIPADLPMEPPVEPVLTEKPVQDYYEETLKEEAAPTATGSGVYDFTTDQPVVSAAEPTAESTPEPTVANISPSEPVTVIPEPVVETEPAPVTEPANYFAPNSFDINQAATPAVPEVPAEPVIPVTDVEAPQAVPVMTPQTTFPAAPAPEVKTLDEMLGEPNTPIPMTDSPVSAYGTMPAEPTPGNIQNEGSMPTVESVFGNQPPATPNSGLPTAQDFGVAPKPKVNPKPKWLIPVLIAVGAIILLAGLSLVLIGLSNRKTAVKYPVTLDQTAIDTLSTNVTTAMQVQQGMAADFSLKADFTSLTANDNITDKTTVEKQLTTPYELNGTWYTDKDGDISTDTAVGESDDKRTYIRSSSETYVYSAATQKYTKESGLVLPGVPALFEADEKAAPLYATNIKIATLVAKEQLDGGEYSKYELTLNDEIIKETLGAIGGVFKDAQYESLNTDNLKFYVWLGADNKLKKVTMAGNLDLETDKISGTIALTGESLYKYLDVTIEIPASPPGAAANTGAPVSATSRNEEEGQTSSIDNNENGVVEAKG